MRALKPQATELHRRLVALVRLDQGTWSSARWWVTRDRRGRQLPPEQHRPRTQMPEWLEHPVVERDESRAEVAAWEALASFDRGRRLSPAEAAKQSQLRDLLLRQMGVDTHRLRPLETIDDVVDAATEIDRRIVGDYRPLAGPARRRDRWMAFLAWGADAGLTASEITALVRTAEKSWMTSPIVTSAVTYAAIEKQVDRVYAAVRQTCPQLRQTCPQRRHVDRRKGGA